MLKTYYERERAQLEVKSSSETNEDSMTPWALSGAKVVPPSLSLVVGKVAEELSSAVVSDVALPREIAASATGLKPSGTLARSYPAAQPTRAPCLF